MPNRYHLTQAELDKLEYEHRHTSAMRIDSKPCNCSVEAGKSAPSRPSPEIDRESVRNHHKRYRKGGLRALLRHDAGGSEAALNSKQHQQLAEYLQSHLCLTSKQVAHYVQHTWQVSYSESGITPLLHRLDFVYKKPKLIPRQGRCRAAADLH